MDQQQGDSLYNQWTHAEDKHHFRFWSSPEFRLDYAKYELEKCSGYYKNTVEVDVINFVGQLQQNPRQHDNQFDHLPAAEPLYCRQWGGGLTVRMLSLGCGPGCDVLAVARILAGDSRVSCIEFVCIDLFPHPLEGPGLLYEKLAPIARDDLKIRLKYFHGNDGDMLKFVPLCRGWNMKFDLVSARYINAIEVVDMFCQSVPALLGQVGRVLLVDNGSKPLRQLSDNAKDTTDTDQYHIYREGKAQIANQIYLVLEKPTLVQAPLMSSG